MGAKKKPSMGAMRRVLESDRGCVLVSAARIEDLLKELLNHRLQSNGLPIKVRDKMFEMNGPLATFSAKLWIAFGFGLIRRELCQDIEAVRRIRNDAAHTASAFDLDDEEHLHRIQNMHAMRFASTKPKRYGIKSGKLDKLDPLIQESIARANGFIKYRKSLFVSVTACVEAELLTILYSTGVRDLASET